MRKLVEGTRQHVGMIEALAPKPAKIVAIAHDDDAEGGAGGRAPAAVVMGEVLAGGGEHGKMRPCGFFARTHDETAGVAGIGAMSEEMLEGGVMNRRSPAAPGGAAQQGQGRVFFAWASRILCTRGFFEQRR